MPDFYFTFLRSRYMLGLLVLLASTTRSVAQNVDFSTIKQDVKGKISTKKPFKISGGVNASSMFYAGNAGAGRDPFTYILNGNVNLSLYGVSVPASFSLTNRGFEYRYQLPNVPNRLSLHPKYKWITGHVGDVAMTFSPYTLNGHQFRGGGIDLTPKGNWKYSAMYGRLQRAVALDTAQRPLLAAYRRIGYGSKFQYEKESTKWGLSFFHAADLLNSLELAPDSLQIYPQENTAISVELAFPVVKNLVWQTETGWSSLTTDTRAPKVNANTAGWWKKTFGGKTATHLYKAVKTQLNYTVGSSTIGVGYERIDPGYQTLGAYYFNNDLENVTASFAQVLFKGKVNLAGNVGFQRDDLKKEKSGGSSRVVSAININYNASERLTTSGTYTNFRTFTNVKPQFQYINQLTPYDNLDTLNFMQLSQNANLNVNYTLGSDKTKPQNLNVNLGFQDAYDKQGGIITKGNASQFYNFAGMYNRTNVQKALSYGGALNITYNTIGTAETITLGPTLHANKQLLDKKLKTGASFSYNTSQSKSETQSQVTSLRLNGSYLYQKKHNLNLSIVGMLRMIASRGQQYDLTGNLSYNYNF